MNFSVEEENLICMYHTSDRKQLSETKQAASPKKAAACSKQHEMEV